MRAPPPLRQLLLVSYFSPPAGGAGVQRALKFCRYLPAHGWRPHVLTVRDGCYLARDETLAAELPHGTPVVRSGSWEPERLPILRRARAAHSGPAALPRRPLLAALRRLWLPDPQVGWLLPALVAARAYLRRQRIDAVMSTSAPFTAHLVAGALARRYHLPWLADFRDAWSADPMGQLSFHTIHRRLERAVLRRARCVVAVTPTIVAGLRDAVPEAPAERFHVLPNGYDPDDFTAPPPRRTAGPWRIRCVGSVYGRIDIRPWLQALALFAAAHPGAQWRMEWYGQMDRAAAQRHAAAVTSAGLQARDRRYGYCSHAAAVAAMRGADVLLLPLYTGAGAEGVMTGKIFEYIASGPPVLLLAGEGVAADLLRTCRAGRTCAPTDVGAMVRALRALYRSREAPRRAHAPRALRAYTRPRQAAGLAALLDGMCE